MFAHPHMPSQVRWFFFPFQIQDRLEEFFNPNINASVWGSHLRCFIAGSVHRAYFLKYMWIKPSEGLLLYFWPYRSVRQCVANLMEKIPFCLLVKFLHEIHFFCHDLRKRSNWSVLKMFWARHLLQSCFFWSPLCPQNYGKLLAVEHELPVWLSHKP